MKKSIVAAGLLASVISSVNAYELSLSIYMPPQAEYANEWWPGREDISDLIRNAIRQGNPQSYLNQTFVKVTSNVFDRDGGVSDDPAVRKALSDRTLSAFLKYQAKMQSFDKNFKYDNEKYLHRASDMIDYLAIPILSKSNPNSETLNEYTTRIRKEAIDKSNGTVWAGGWVLESHWAAKIGGGGQDWDVPAKVVGVQYNSLISELSTILLAARAANAEMEVLTQIENAAKLSTADVHDAVEKYNESIGKGGLEHPVDVLYGHIKEQEPILADAVTKYKTGGALAAYQEVRWQRGQVFRNLNSEDGYYPGRDRAGQIIRKHRDNPQSVVMIGVEALNHYLDQIDTSKKHDIMKEIDELPFWQRWFKNYGDAGHGSDASNRLKSLLMRASMPGAL